MSLYSRYSESSISVSYFSRSSALICSDVLFLPLSPPSPPSRPPGRKVSPHLSSPEFAPLARRVGFALGHHPCVRTLARLGRHPPDVDERIPVLSAGPQPGQRHAVRRRAVALVFGEPVTGVV